MGLVLYPCLYYNPFLYGFQAIFHKFLDFGIVHKFWGVIMYESAKIATAIKERAKIVGVPLKEMLSTLNLNKNVLSNLYKGSMIKSDSLALIADHLNCSVDYLLGRTETPQLLPEGVDLAEMHVLNLYRQLNGEGMKKAADFMQDLIDTGKYKKYDKIDIELNA